MLQKSEDKKMNWFEYTKKHKMRKKFFTIRKCFNLENFASL